MRELAAVERGCRLQTSLGALEVGFVLLATGFDGRRPGGELVGDDGIKKTCTHGLPQGAGVALLHPPRLAMDTKGLWFKRRAEEAGFATAVRERDSGDPIAAEPARPSFPRRRP